MRTIIVSLVIGILICGCSTHSSRNDRAFQERGREFQHNCFPTNEAAIQLGNKLLSSVLTERSGNGKEYWGATVSFYGGGAPPGGNANLMIAQNVLLFVEIDPFQNVVPAAAAYEACVLGELIYIDQKMRIIYIKAKPENWRHGDTM